MLIGVASHAAESFASQAESSEVLATLDDLIVRTSAVDEAGEAAKIAEQQRHEGCRWVALFLKAAEAFVSRKLR